MYRERGQIDVCLYRAGRLRCILSNLSKGLSSPSLPYSPSSSSEADVFLMSAFVIVSVNFSSRVVSVISFPLILSFLSSLRVLAETFIWQQCIIPSAVSRGNLQIYRHINTRVLFA